MKRVLIVLGSLPGFLAILFTITSNKVVTTSGSESINKIIKYSSELGKTIESDSSLLFIVMKVSEYSHIIITIGVIWIVICMFLWGKTIGDENK